MKFFCLFLSLILHSTISSASEDWCYEIQTKSTATCKGPTKWTELVNATCGGKNQSPIDIKNAKFDSALIPFKFVGYDKELECTLSNNGHTAVLTPVGTETIEISAGGLSGTYSIAQLHFHWGNEGIKGSEHTLNGVRYPMELHIVHAKKTTRSEPSGGSTTSGSNAVLGFFFEEGATNSHYANLISGLSKIGSPGTTTTVSKVTLQDLIPVSKDLEVFYRYQGSLTTPSCAETVTWTLFSKPIKLDKSQIAAFYGNLKYSDGKNMGENFRPVQDLNERKITTSGIDVILPQTRYFLISLFVFYFTLVF
ncbi:carbonic anhydrase 4 [Anomaloglossus baeobatrachus]|uniref:carbonic anhydrase 4 n=1 Tax=Anomaloglossus baeobatrachus TaxID=238106 RepID=UPI003F50708D